MKKIIFALFLAFAGTTLFSSFKAVEVNKPLSGTIVGYTLDASYYYTVVADLGTASPHPITTIQVSRLSDGAELTTLSASGAVTVGIHSAISGTATVTFVDNGVTVTKSLTGGLQGGILP